jgi:hypothetical protein
VFAANPEKVGRDGIEPAEPKPNLKMGLVEYSLKLMRAAVEGELVNSLPSTSLR